MAKVTKLRTGARPKSKPTKQATSPRESGGFLGVTPLAMIVYGPPGVGKTEFAAHFPGAGFLYDPQEQGIIDLFRFDRVPKPEFCEEVSSWKELISQIESVRDNALCETLVIDSLTGFEKLCFVEHCEANFDGDWSKGGFYSFQQGPVNASKTDWPAFIDAINSCRNVGISVILLAHSQVKTFNNPTGPDYDRYTPYVHKDIWQHCHRWSQATLFYNFDVSFIERKGTPALKRKTKSADERSIYTTWSPSHDAKNRFGLPPIILAGSSGKEAFENFKTAFEAGVPD